VSVIWRKPVLTYAVSVVSLTASVNSVIRPVRQSAECGRQRNSAAELKPNPNFSPDYKRPFLTLTPFCILCIPHFTRNRELFNWHIFAVFCGITKQISTVSLDQHWKLYPQSCNVTLGQHYTTSGHNFSVLTSTSVNQ